jgi:hypothetical protein
MLGVDWNAIGAIASVAAVAVAVLGGLAKWVVNEVRQNREEVLEVKGKVTTPDSVPGTIGATVAQLAIDTQDHNVVDEARFKMLWNELGKEEPQA